MQRNEQRVIAGELIEAVEVLGIGHLVIMQRAERALNNVVQPEIGARREIQRQDRIVPPGNVDSGNPVQVAVGDDLFDAFFDLVRLTSRRGGERSAGCGVAPERKRAQAERAIEVLICRGQAVFLGRTRCGIVDQVDAGGRRDAVAGAENLSLGRGRKRDRITRPIRRTETEAAEIVEHARAPVGVA
jgi:hypothetical protein